MNEIEMREWLQKRINGSTTSLQDWASTIGISKMTLLSFLYGERRIFRKTVVKLRRYIERHAE